MTTLSLNTVSHIRDCAAALITAVNSTPTNELLHQNLGSSFLSHISLVMRKFYVYQRIDDRAIAIADPS